MARGTKINPNGAVTVCAILMHVFEEDRNWPELLVYVSLVRCLHSFYLSLNTSTNSDVCLHVAYGMYTLPTLYLGVQKTGASMCKSAWLLLFEILNFFM